MAMSTVTVDTTAGGITLFAGGPARRITICNGAVTIALKLDKSATALTFANGIPMAVNGVYEIAVPYDAKFGGYVWPNAIKAISSATSSSVQVHVVE